MSSTQKWGLLPLLLLLPLAAGIPRPQAGPPAGVTPSVNNLTMFGTGCPLGGGAIIQQMRNNTPVFVFSEWDLSLPSADVDAAAPAGSVAKWCNEEISLGNGPVGLRLRIASVTVGGWAALDAGTQISLQVETWLGGEVAGKQTALIGPADLKAGAFEVQLATAPTSIWSACVGASGDVPHLTVKTTVGLVGSKLPDGTYSKGVLGGKQNELDKALRINFTPAWQPCPASPGALPGK